MKNEKRNRKQAYSQKVIREAMLNILKTTPLSKVTVTDICKRADVNRTTFYANYDDIYDLLDSIAQELYETIRQVLMQYDAMDGYAYYHILLEAIRDNADICVAALQISDQEYQALKVDFHYDRIMETRKCRSFQGIGLESNLIMDYVLAGTRSLINKWLMDDMSIPIDVMAEHLYTINSHLLDYYDENKRR